VSRYEDRFNDKDKSSPEKEAVPPALEEAAPSTKNVPVTTESKEKEEPQEESLIKKVWKKKTTLEEVVKDKSLSPKSKSTLPGKEVWKIKGSLSSSPKEEVQSGLPSRPSDIPWDV